MNSGQNDNKNKNNSYSEERQQPFHIVHDENTVKQAADSNKISIFQAPKMKKKRRDRSILSTLLTVLAASIIGILFGVGILQMFISLNDQPAASEVTPEITQPATAAEPTSEISTFQVPSLSGYMIQAGVFSEIENAEEWKLEFSSNNVPALLWEMEQQYYLFLGVYETEEIARIKINEFGEEVELFIKPWQTTAKEVEVTSEEEAWITQFQAQWDEGLMTKETAGFPELSAGMEQSNILNEMISYIEMNQQGENREQFYLDLIYLYEQLGKDI